jgi:hypothetical protein
MNKSKIRPRKPFLKELKRTLTNPIRAKLMIMKKRAPVKVLSRVCWTPRATLTRKNRREILSQVRDLKHFKVTKFNKKKEKLSQKKINRHQTRILMKKDKNLPGNLTLGTLMNQMRTKKSPNQSQPNHQRQSKQRSKAKETLEMLRTLKMRKLQ